VERPGSEYELSFEGLVIVAVEGGTFMRSRECPEHRLHIARLDADPARQFEPITAAASNAEGLGLGIRGRAIVIPERRDGEYHLYVRVIALPRLLPMTPAETAEFIRRFNIG